MDPSRYSDVNSWFSPGSDLFSTPLQTEPCDQSVFKRFDSSSSPRLPEEEEEEEDVTTDTTCSAPVVLLHGTTLTRRFVRDFDVFGKFELHSDPMQTEERSIQMCLLFLE
ncbi:hypothetical protein EYF80_062012 [Liparis tanakae]|uniref:Uncharacterized protein n=1 Tax=Liparis tanakae TaxID=230148 RepID=A0A4Z2EHN7_9TELE|nr:hypothetical protein EYF80_062012 [Liparis tanakae]